MVSTDSGFSGTDWIARGEQAQMGNYRPMPIVVSHGEGARVYDVDGRMFIDLVSGIAVSALGHNHPRLVAAVREQAGKVMHTSNIVWNQQAVELAERLTRSSFADRVYFANSGAEANEAMLKLARKVFFDRGEGRYEFICMEKSFHGRTMATVTCTGQPKYHRGFEPLLPGVKYVPFGDIQALEAAFSRRTAAVLLEPIQGEGGMRLPPMGYMRAVRQLCNKHGALMLLDEVQSGVGRTGKLFAYEHEDILPDAISLAKGLGGGMPIGAMLTTEALAAHLTYGSHASTFGGNPVSCAAANVVMDEVTKPAFLEHVRTEGAYARARLQEMAARFPGLITDVRGRGLWLGAELSVDGSGLARAAAERGLLLNVIGGQVVRIAPPLVIDRPCLDAGLDILESLLAELPTS